MVVSMSRSTEETAEVVQIIAQERVSKRTGDDDEFLLIQNADDKRDKIEEKKKKFLTLKDMSMPLTGGWCEERWPQD